MKIAVIFCWSALLAMLAMTGCSNVYYENRAVERARAYLLENSPELTADQRAFVRYNQPIVLEEGIFGGSGAAVSDQSHICITWLIPGRKDAYLVFGASDIRLQSWYPNRLIRKTFVKSEENLIPAAETARKYALNGLYYDLSKHEYNCVRFEMPRPRRTDFILPQDPDPKKQEARKDLVQYSLVWSPREQENTVVVYGLAKPDLAGFMVLGGGVMSPGYLNSHTLKDASAPAADKK